MTEIKRFTMEYSYHDEEYVYRDNGEILTPSQVLHLLDDLNDKNKFLSDFRGFVSMEHQKLKEENEELKIDIGILKDNHEIDREIIDDLHEYVKKLEKENKELKAKVDDKEVAVEVEYEKLMQKVFEVIDKKINEYIYKEKLYKHKGKDREASVFNLYCLCLNNLKKELSE